MQLGTSYPTSKEIECRFDNGLFGSRNIYISSNDLDWVSARTKELEDFIDEHRNFHWIFNLPFLLIVSLFFVSLLVAILVYFFKIPLSTSILFTPLVFVIGFYLWSPITSVFPFVYVESGRASNRKLIRQFLSWIIPALAVAIVTGLLLKALGISQ